MKMNLSSKQNLCSSSSPETDANKVLDESASKEIVSAVPRER